MGEASAAEEMLYKLSFSVAALCSGAACRLMLVRRYSVRTPFVATTPFPPLGLSTLSPPS